MSDLKRLSDNATAGVWTLDPDTLMIETDRAEFAADCWDGMATGKHNAAFIAALVNAYRAGRLVERGVGDV